MRLKCRGPQGPALDGNLHSTWSDVALTSSAVHVHAHVLSIFAQIIRLSFSVMRWLREKAGQILALSLPEIGKQLFRFSKQILFVYN